MNPPAHTLLFFFAKTRLSPHIFISPLWCSTCQHTYSIIKPRCFPPAHIFTCENRIITRQHTHQYWLLHSKLSPEMPCKYLQPASTHLLMFRMHVSTRQHTWLHFRRYLHPSAHTFVCPKPVSTHRALDYFVYPPSAHILSGSYRLNLQPRITVQRAEPSRQHTYRTGWFRNGLRSHIVVVQAW